MHLKKELIRQRLASFAAEYSPSTEKSSSRVPSRELHPAAVLIPFIYRDETWHVLFIHRADNANDRHSGQVAFPGGRTNPNDTNALGTALRETREEIGVTPRQIEIFGKLNDFVTVTDYRITPFVGAIPASAKLTRQPEEVRRIFTIPLVWLANPNNFTISERRDNAGNALQLITYREYDHEVLWGASARIMHTLLHTLKLLP